MTEEQYISERIKTRIQNYESDMKALNEFRNELSVLASSLQEKNCYPLVIIVDELDRCKPAYAIEMLERIKHLFSVHGVVFLLVSNMEQLRGYVRSVHGLDTEAEEYLEKFINATIAIPKNRKTNEGDNSLYCQLQCRARDTILGADARTAAKLTAYYADHFSFSFRNIESVFHRLDILTPRMTDFLLAFQPIVIFVVFIRIHDSALYRELSAREISYSDFLNKIDISDSVPENNSFRLPHLVMAWMRTLLDTSMHDNRLEQVGFSRSRDDELPSDIENTLCQNAMDYPDAIPAITKAIDLGHA